MEIFADFSDDFKAVLHLIGAWHNVPMSTLVTILVFHLAIVLIVKQICQLQLNFIDK